jgi:hypothetical protein
MRRHVIPLILCAGACAPAERAGDWVITVDTLNGGAGPVRVVNAPPVGAQDAVTWRLEEELRIGAVEGSGAFGAIAQLAVDAESRVAALDYQAHELRVFAPDGTLLRTVTGPGEGPGELKQPIGVITDGDRFLVPEVGNARLSVFTAETGFVGSHPGRIHLYGRDGWDAAVDSAGRIHVLSAGPVPEGSGQFLVRIYDDRMTQLDSFPQRTYEQVERVHAAASWVIRRGRGSQYIYVPFYAVPLEVLDRTGAIWFAEAPLTYRLKRYLPAGDTLRVVEVGRAPRPIPPAVRDSAIDDLRGKLAAQGSDIELDWSLVPELYATIHGISLSDEGDLWVRTSSSDESPTRYDVLDPEGRYRGTAEISGRVKRQVEPVVRGDRVWAVVVGELDEESIVVGRLVEVPAT